VGAYLKQNIMKTLRLITNLCFFLLAGTAFSQVGLQGIVVEKFYQANAADVAGQETGAATPLTTSSVTYRVYVDMAAGWKFNQIFAVPGNSLTVNTTTGFYNDPGYGVTVNPHSISAANNAKKTTALDSWFTTGGAVNGKSGVLKTDDTDGSFTNTNGLLTNNPGGCFGAPIQGAGAKDGYMPTQSSPSTYAAPNALGGFTSIPVLDATNGGSITITDGALAALGGIVGATSSNMVLIGQFTTTGQFSFALNVQIQNTTSGAVENYYASNPPSGSTNFTHSTLTLAANTPPTVTLASAPSTSGIITGTSMTFTATATDANGTVTGVQFFDNGVLLTGTVSNTPPSSSYTYAYTASVNGAHAITAKATDNDCAVTTSTAHNFTVAANQAPTVSSLTAPATAYLGSNVTFTCAANDVDGTVASVEFFVNSVSIGNGTLSGGTYSKTYAVPSNVNGTYSVQAKATDNLGLAGSFATTSMNVIANTPPTVALTNPTASQLISAPTVITITANATDVDGISGVNFYVNGTLVGAGTNTSGNTWSYAWTSTPGVKTFTAIATDNFQATATSAAVTLDIADPNALPYRVKNVTQNCDQTVYLMPVAVSNTYTVDNVIGYDIALTYDASKLTPTGNVFVANALYPNAAHIETATSIGTPSGNNGTMQISLNFNGNAPASAEFNGTNADIFTVQFTKTSAFAGLDSATVAIASIQESYITGVLNKTANSGKAYSIKDQNYPATLSFWSDNQPIRYNSANPNAFLITNVNGAITTIGAATSASTALTIPNTVSGVVAGMKVVADGVPSTATVASVSGTTVTLSVATTAALNATPVTFVAASAVQPNTSGVFTHVLTNGQKLNISRDISNNNSVQLLVNAADAVLGKTLLLNGNFTPNVYQIMALDVNLDGVVSAGDISQIKQRATLAIPEFRQAWNYSAAGVSNGHPSKDWIFVDKTTATGNAAYQISSTFPANDGVGYSKAQVPVTPFSISANVTNYSTCPEIQTETYYGIMLGDVNASYATYTADGLLKSAGAVVLDLTAAQQEGNTFRIPVSFEATEQVNALDFAVKFNNANYSEVVSLDQTSEATAFMNNDDQTMRFSGFNVSNFATGANVAELIVTTENGKLSEKNFQSELAILNGKPVDMKFAKSSEAIQQVLNVQVYPNPNNGTFAVESVEGASVSVYDMNGRLIAEEGQIPASGKLAITLPKVNTGVYFVRVQNANFSAMKKVIIE
jgi:hypothetical protein